MHLHLYRFHFLDVTGTVTGRHSVRLSTDDAAINAGRRMLENRSQDNAVQIWHRNRLVRYESRPKGAAVSWP